MFEGLCLVRMPHLKLEDWDLANTERFPHLATDNFMQRVFYKDSGVIALEPVKWISWVEKERFMILLWVSYYHHAPINLIVIKQLLCLVHDECLRLEDPIPITNMLNHRIILLPHSRLNMAKALVERQASMTSLSE